MQQIILRHLSGSLAGQTKEIPLSDFTELTFGRVPESGVRYSEQEDIVSRKHARLIPDPADPAQFLLEDLNSTHGTYVNKRRIAGSVRIQPGDKIQFGPGGPDVEFDLDPRPEIAAKPTRAVEIVRPTREVEAIPMSREALSGSMEAVKASPSERGVSRETMQQAIAESRQESRKFMGVGIAVGVILLGALAGVLLLSKNRVPSPSPTVPSTAGHNTVSVTPAAIKTFTQIETENSPTVVRIMLSWHLIHSPTGKQLYHLYMRVGSKRTPVYIDTGDGKPEPVLTFEDNGINEPIGESLRGTGFLVKKDGFILTCRHVVSPWRHTYSLPGPGLFYNREGRFPRVIEEGPTDWVPENARYIERHRGAPIKIDDRTVTGRREFLDVKFKKAKNRVDARWIKDSPEHDVSLIKIEPAETPPVAETYDSYDESKKGDNVCVIAYFGAERFKRSKEDSSSFMSVEDTVIGKGIIQNIEKEQTGVVGFHTDTFQLDINSLGPGSSGGPVFDDRGRAIAVLSYRTTRAGTTVTHAVPIRFGQKLLSNRDE
jgi:serine protease Do